MNSGSKISVTRPNAQGDSITAYVSRVPCVGEILQLSDDTKYWGRVERVNWMPDGSAVITVNPSSESTSAAQP